MAFSEELEAVRGQFESGVARFESSLAPDWIEEALRQTGAASICRRKLPADQAIWLVKVSEAWADDDSAESLWHGLSGYAADGSWIRVADSDETYEFFGKARNSEPSDEVGAHDPAHLG